VIKGENLKKISNLISEGPEGPYGTTEMTAEKIFDKNGTLVKLYYTVKLFKKGKRKPYSVHYFDDEWEADKYFNSVKGRVHRKSKRLRA